MIVGRLPSAACRRVSAFHPKLTGSSRPIADIDLSQIAFVLLRASDPVIIFVGASVAPGNAPGWAEDRVWPIVSARLGETSSMHGKEFWLGVASIFILAWLLVWQGHRIFGGG